MTARNVIGSVPRGVEEQRVISVRVSTSGQHDADHEAGVRRVAAPLPTTSAQDVAPFSAERQADADLGVRWPTAYDITP